MEVLFIGDIFAKQGVQTVKKGLDQLKKEIQWDYKNIVKRKGVLERLK